MKKTLLFIFITAFSFAKAQLVKDSAKYTIIDTTKYQLDSAGNMIFDSVQIESEFVGGATSWRNFLVNNLKVDEVRDKLPKKLLRNKIKQSVELQFIVCNDGSLCNFSVLNDSAIIHPAFKEEALRVIKLSPNWLPGIQNNIPVKSIKRQRIIFVID